MSPFPNIIEASLFSPNPEAKAAGRVGGETLVMPPAPLEGQLVFADCRGRILDKVKGQKGEG